MAKGKSALRFVVREAQKAGSALSNAILGPSTKRRTKPRYVKGVHKGQFYRYKIKDETKPKEVPKLPPIGPQTMPQPLKTPPPPSTHEPPLTAAEKVASSRGYEWIQQNLAVLILNFGSICTLTGFTRSDVLELRGFAMTGSLCSVLYFTTLRPFNWTPILWSSVFASVNAFKIAQILSERKGRVELTAEEEEIFVEHFMPHGVTPKQFDKIWNAAKRVSFRKGELIVRQGSVLEHVYLVVKGRTRASVLGRRLTAISSAPGYRDVQQGGDSGAWVGEMAFLEALAEKETKDHKREMERVQQAKNGKQNSPAEQPDVANKQSEEEEESENEEGHRLGTAIFTVVAAEDCDFLVWTHEDIERLMKQSTDMRAAMTRAMTAPIVGKVINFTVSTMRKTLPSWSAWLDDWKSSGAVVNVRRQDTVGPDVLGEPSLKPAD